MFNWKTKDHGVDSDQLLSLATECKIRECVLSVTVFVGQGAGFPFNGCFTPGCRHGVRGAEDAGVNEGAGLHIIAELGAGSG